jgi:hypothetical protein
VITEFTSLCRLLDNLFFFLFFPLPKKWHGNRIIKPLSPNEVKMVKRTLMSFEIRREGVKIIKKKKLTLMTLHGEDPQ